MGSGHPARPVPALALILAGFLFLVACQGGEEPSSPPEADSTAGTGGAARSYLQGISAQPAQFSELSYRETFQLAGEAGEVVLIQRTPPWADFVPGGTVSSETSQLTRLEKELADENDLRLFLAVDPTTPGNRGQIAGLPEDLAGADFTDPDLRAAFVAYAKYLALNYKPDYLALGIEVDMIYAARGDASFRNLLSLYFEAYDAVKSESPDTMVFPTFQFEDMLGILDTGEQRLPAWSLIERFEPKLDMLAISSFPGLVFDDIDEVPADYYDALTERIDKPISLVSIGWSSQRSNGEHDESQQVSYLYRVLGAAEELDARLVVWYLGRDPETVPPGFEALATMGLLDASGNPKSAWRIWLSSGSRPLPPAAP